MPYLVPNSYFGLAAEAVYGSAASIGVFTPITSPKVTPNLVWLDDSAFRGSPVMHYDQVPGVRHDTFDGKTFMYSDVYPNLIRAILGGTDTVASVGPSLWTHTLGVLNSPNTGSQPPSYTIDNYSVDKTYQILAARMVSMSIAFAANAAVETTFQFEGNISSTVASVQVNETTQHFVPSWACTASIGGQAVTVVESAQIDFKRSTAPIFTLGQQGPYNNFAGPLEVTGQGVLIIENSEPYYANALTRDQQQIIWQFTDPATGYYVQFTGSNVQLGDPIVDQSKNYLSLQTKMTYVANTTDAIFGYSPIKAVVSNNVSTSY